MPTMHPDHDTVRAAIAMAVRAPSVHNTQPWLWRVADSTVHLYADDTHRLRHTDPDCRELVVSCGAALHHFQVAVRAFGWQPFVRRLPDPANPRHLASIGFRTGQADMNAVRAVRAIAQRRSDRRRYSSRGIPAAELTAVMAAGAEIPGIRVRELDTAGEQARLLCAFGAAGSTHARDAGYTAELSAWSGHHAAPLGVAARNAVLPSSPLTRPFQDPRLAEATAADCGDAARMLVLCTGSEDLRAWLRAGEAAGAVLVAATMRGLATCPLSEPLEVSETRWRIHRDLLGGFGYPQLIIRMGWAATGAEPVPATARLPLDEVVGPLEPLDLSGARQ